MKKIVVLFALTAAVSLSFGQTYKTPKKLFKKLVKTIRHSDLSTYSTLWDGETVDSEGMVSTLLKDPDEWEDLWAIFEGPQKITEGQFYESDGREFFKAKIKAPKGRGGGIGNIRMVKNDGSWQMYKW